jgi:hypothetical protein
MEGVFGVRTISFNTTGGSYVSAQKLLRGETVSLPNNPVRLNSIFEAWYEDHTLRTGWDFENIPDGDKTLYAGWLDFYLSVSPESICFGPVITNYANIGAQTVTVFNYNDIPTGDLSITLGGDNPDYFVLSAALILSLESNASGSFNVVPVSGLPAGMYTATVTISNINLFSSIDISFVVEPAPLTQQGFIISIGDITDGNLNGYIDSGVILSRSNNNSEQFSINADNSVVQWFYGATPLHTGPSINLQVSDTPGAPGYNAPYNLIGIHFLTVVVTIDDVPFFRSIEFEVVEN